MTILVLLGLLIGVIGRECFAYGPFYCPVCSTDYSVAGEHGGTKCSRSSTKSISTKATRYYCKPCNVLYDTPGEHGGRKCERKVVKTSVDSRRLPSEVPPKTATTTATLRSVCGNCRHPANDCRCRRNGFSFFDVRTLVNIQRAPYWPSRRRMIYFNNVYSGRQIRYLGSNWGWGRTR